MITRRQVIESSSLQTSSIPPSRESKKNCLDTEISRRDTLIRLAAVRLKDIYESLVEENEGSTEWITICLSLCEEYCADGQ